MRLVGEDWRGVDLSRGSGGAVTLEECRLSGAVLDGSVWWSCRWEGCALDEVSWRGGEVVEGVLRGVDLRRVAAPASEFTRTRFEACEFGGGRLERARFERCEFVGCDFTAVVWSRAELLDCRFRDCVGDGGEVAGLELGGTRFEGCRQLSWWRRSAAERN